MPSDLIESLELSLFAEIPDTSKTESPPLQKNSQTTEGSEKPILKATCNSMYLTLKWYNFGSREQIIGC